METTTQHTPGPWATGKAYGTATDHAICANGGVLAKVIGQGYPIGEGWSPQSEANAHLMAAAPDLLEACIAALDVLDVHNMAQFGTAPFLRAAINKARGTT